MCQPAADQQKPDGLGTKRHLTMARCMHASMSDSFPAAIATGACLQPLKRYAKFWRLSPLKVCALMGFTNIIHYIMIERVEFIWLFFWHRPAAARATLRPGTHSCGCGSAFDVLSFHRSSMLCCQAHLQLVKRRADLALTLADAVLHLVPCLHQPLHAAQVRLHLCEIKAPTK